MAVRVITDSASYLPPDVRSRHGIVEVPLFVREDEVVTPETEIDRDAFYARLVTAPALPTTSQPAPLDFARVFSDAVAKGFDVIAVLISGGMSGTVSSAETAARMVRESSPGAGIAVVDSRANCMQEGFAVLAAAEVASAGGALAECERAARESMRRSRFLFTPVTLDYLRRGGRISAAAALLGSVLRIVPVLTAEAGSTGVAGRARTHRRALDTIAKLVAADVERCGLKQIVVQTIADIEPGIAFSRDYIEPIAGRPVPVIPIGPAVGLHVGPAIGVTYETIEPLQ
jgi:DegV family protein with EDD domain